MIILAAFLLLVYCWFPTKNHYWDGIGFALNIEGLGEDSQGVVRNQGDFRGLSSIYFNPNHLFYNLIGYLLYKPLHYALPNLRALEMLRAISTLLSVGTACLLFLSLHRWSRNIGLSVWLTLLMALSATWWKFSTDADAYVPSTFLLMLATYLTTDPIRRPSGWKIGLLHALSMLLHQIAIGFMPAALVALWSHPYWLERSERKRAVLEYLLAAGVPVLGAYVWVWFGGFDNSRSSSQFLTWLTSNGGDTLAFQSFGVNMLESLRSLLRVFFGGRISLAMTFVEVPLLFVLVAAMAYGVVQFLLGVGRALIARNPSPRNSTEPALPDTRFLTIWAGVFTVFLFFWLTEYPYYRLFCLPAMIFLIGALIRPRESLHGPTDYVPKPLLAFVVFMAAFNFATYIYPYSQPEATPPILLGMRASTIVKGDAVILYKDFTCDNWIMRYFNPRTTWIRANFDDREALAGSLRKAFSKDQSVWVDTTLLGQLNTIPEMQAWLLQQAVMSEPWGLVNKKHHIQFAQLVPR